MINFIILRNNKLYEEVANDCGLKEFTTYKLSKKELDDFELPQGINVLFGMGLKKIYPTKIGKFNDAYMQNVGGTLITYSIEVIFDEGGPFKYEQIINTVNKAIQLDNGTMPVLPVFEFEHVIDSERATQVFRAYRDCVLACDVETTGLSIVDTDMTMVSITTEDANYAINWDCVDTVELAEFLDSNVSIWHNFKFDAQRVYKHTGLWLQPAQFEDTMLMSITQSEQRGNNGLKFLARSVFDAESYTFEESFDTVSMEVLAPYAAKDTYFTYHLYKHFEQIMDDDDWKLYNTCLKPNSLLLAQIEYNGVAVNNEALKYALETLKHDASVLNINLSIDIRNTGFLPNSKDSMFINLNSPKQLAEFFYDHLKMKPVRGKRTTGKEFLEAYAGTNEFVDTLAQHRKINKLVTSYLSKFDMYVHGDNKLHPNYWINGTVSGRLSATEPALQTIPKHSKQKETIRKIFVASPGKVLVTSDFKQLELRVLAYLANDKQMMVDLQSTDFHTATASKVFKIPFDEVDEHSRFLAKAINFGIVYNISANKLGQDIKVSTVKAQQLINDWLNGYPNVKSFLQSEKDKAWNTGQLITPVGRKRRWQLFTPSLQKRIANQASNFQTQSFANEIALYCARNINNELNKLGIGSVCLLVHDEIMSEVLDVPEVIEQTKQVYNEYFGKVWFDSDIEFAGDEVSIGYNWAEVM